MASHELPLVVVTELEPTCTDLLDEKQAVVTEVEPAYFDLLDGKVESVSIEQFNLASATEQAERREARNSGAQNAEDPLAAMRYKGTRLVNLSLLKQEDAELAYNFDE